MNINIVAVGKIKEKYLKEAIEEYSKRLSRFCKLKITEVPDEPMSDRPNDAEKAAVLKKEAEKITSAISTTDVLVTLCVEGKQLSSEKFADFFANGTVSGASTFTFVIGGSLGLSDEIKAKSKLRLSFSEMTFPHQLMRVILLEQVYRAFKINSNENYHK
ncbi:MAG: 23S rRNA (pseudouridine(1915)-N(3))-methyltransferase RlmH [Clostridia bacterium]|nr:23S rRNA (pseudouridine(1915)-N(3))-methyltransferase RlmH [Clostridia bacterium]